LIHTHIPIVLQSFRRASPFTTPRHRLVSAAGAKHGSAGGFAHCHLKISYDFPSKSETSHDFWKILCVFPLISGISGRFCGLFFQIFWGNTWGEKDLRLIFQEDLWLGGAFRGAQRKSLFLGSNVVS